MLRSALTIEASITVEDALEALKAFPKKTDIVIRRRDGSHVYWYAKKVGDLRRLPDDLGLDCLTHSLKTAFDLHKYQASRSYQLELSSRGGLEAVSGVLLDGEQVIGVLEPLPRRAASRSGYCIKCRTKRDIKDAKFITMKNGRPATLAVCSVCGTKMFRIGKSSSIIIGKRSRIMSSRSSVTIRRLVRKPKGDGEEHVMPEVQTISPYPRLNAPDNVTPDQQFDLAIGLSLEQRTGVAGGPLTITTAEEEFDLVVQVVAQGFQAPDGIRRFLHVHRSHFQEAETKVRLIAPHVQDLLVSALEVEFSYQGNLLGRAWREIRVVPEGVPTPAGEVRAGATPIGPSSPETTPDLTVTINEGPDGSTLVWAFVTPHPVELPKDQVEKKFKQHNAQTFAIQEIKSVADADGTLLIDEKVRGLARNIADQMPLEFWDVLGKVWTHVKGTQLGQVPSLLLVSSEPYIPWELASTEDDYIDKSLVDATKPLLIGAQLRVGRWLPEGPRTPRGLRRPKLPPEVNVSIKKMAIVVGDYLATSGQRPLPKAKEEGKTLSERYPAVRLNATEEEVNRLLENQLTEGGEPVSVQAIHFACHGEVNPDTPYNGIVLSDQTLRLSDTIIRGGQMTRANEPFVFVNACQLGLSSEILADYGGLAGAFLKEGCRGFIAPLWSVSDQVAHELALEFYKRTLDENLEVSEVMREMRSKFDMKADRPPSTYLAYVFYGHPKLALNKAF